MSMLLGLGLGRLWHGLHLLPFPHSGESEVWRLELAVVGLDVLHYVQIVVDSSGVATTGHSFLEVHEDVLASAAWLEAEEVLNLAVIGGGHILFKLKVYLTSSCVPRRP